MGVMRKNLRAAGYAVVGRGAKKVCWRLMYKDSGGL